MAAPVARAVAPALSVVKRDAASLVGTDVDDDIDVVDVIDPDLFPIFEEEAAELLPQLGGALRQWAARPDNLGARSEVLRALHTLKGSSRLAGAMRLGEMAHRLESAIEQIDAETVTVDQVEPLLASFDNLEANFQTLSCPCRSRPQRRCRGRSGSRFRGHQSLRLNPCRLKAVQVLPPPYQLCVCLLRRNWLRCVLRPNQSVRVRAQLLDRLVNQAGEVMISRSRLDVRLGQFRSSLNDLSGNLDRLRQQLRDIEVQAESQMQSRMALAKDSAGRFRPAGI